MNKVKQFFKLFVKAIWKSDRRRGCSTLVIKVMKKIKFYIVDVFANNKYQGNQLAVFEDFENQVSQEEMQQIAREINFAIT